MSNQIQDKPEAEVFQGSNAIIKILQEILQNTKEIKVIGSKENALEKIGHHAEKFQIDRLDKKIKIKQILEKSKDSMRIKQNKYTEVRFLKNFSKSKEAIFIKQNYVYHIIFQYELSAIRIKSKEHAKNMEIIFDELWEKATSK